MSKIEINLVAATLKKHEVPPETLRAIIEDLHFEAQPEPGTEEERPTVKKQFVILISDPEHRLPDTDFAGWVLQIPEDESPVSTQDRINRAAYEYNRSRKGKLYPAKTVGEALENVPAKHFRETECWVKTKTPVLMLRTDNEIPKEVSGD